MKAQLKRDVAVTSIVLFALYIIYQLHIYNQIRNFWRSCGAVENLNFVLLDGYPTKITGATGKRPFTLNDITSVALFEHQLPFFQIVVASLNAVLGDKSQLSIYGVYSEGKKIRKTQLVGVHLEKSFKTRSGILIGYIIQGTVSRINITILYERKNQIDKKDVGFMWEPWSSEGFPRAFLPFEISPIKIAGLRHGLFNVPSNASHFKWQKKFAKFIACDQSRAAAFAKKSKRPTQLHPVKDAARIKWDMKLITTLQRQMASWHRPNWIFSGTLLGWYRQCSLIPHDHDVDTSSWVSDYSPWMIPFFVNHPIIPLDLKFGLVEDSLEFKMGKRGQRSIDLFWLYPHEGKPTLPELEKEAWIGYQIFDKKHTKKVGFHPSVDSICSTDLHGYLIYIPCDVWPQIKIFYAELSMVITGLNQFPIMTIRRILIINDQMVHGQITNGNMKSLHLINNIHIGLDLRKKWEIGPSCPLDKVS